MNDFRNRDFFHEGMREFQDLFDGRRTAEAIETNRKHYEFWDDEKELIKNAQFFFIASSWKQKSASVCASVSMDYSEIWA